MPITDNFNVASLLRNICNFDKKHGPQFQIFPHSFVNLQLNDGYCYWNGLLISLNTLKMNIFSS